VLGDCRPADICCSESLSELQKVNSDAFFTSE